MQIIFKNLFLYSGLVTYEIINFKLQNNNLFIFFLIFFNF